MTARAYLILVLFLIWSAFSWWWYTCKIKGLCPSGSYQTANITGNQDQESDVESKVLSSDNVSSNDDKVSDEDQTKQELDEGASGENGMDKSGDSPESDESDSETVSENPNVTDDNVTGENHNTENTTGDSQEFENTSSDSDETSEIPEEIIDSKSSESENIVRLEDKTLIYFDYLSDNPELNSVAQNYLNQIANDLNKDKYKSILVTGYTDNIGNTKNNYYKGLDRARAIQDYLMQNGARENQIELRSYGEYRPIDDNSTEEGRAKNRRVEIKLNY